MSKQNIDININLIPALFMIYTTISELKTMYIAIVNRFIRLFATFAPDVNIKEPVAPMYVLLTNALRFVDKFNSMAKENFQNHLYWNVNL